MAPLQLAAAPVFAILRGVRPGEILGIAAALIDAGVRAIEIPLNSPEPLTSIRLLCETYRDSCICGAGTVLEPAQVDAVREAGGRLIVAPNTNVDVIRRAVGSGLIAIPGFATATEAFVALGAGARHLKLFPAATYGPAHVQALRAVLPAEASIHAVGGVDLRSIPAWVNAGIAGIGVGSEIFRPGWSAQEVGQRARAVVAAFQSAQRPS